MNDSEKTLTGISYKGIVLAPYDTLVAAFGSPREPKYLDHKIDVEWIISTPYGVAVIYNYKNGKRYLGKNGIAIKEMRSWHVGGKNDESCTWVAQHLEKQKIIYKQNIK